MNAILTGARLQLSRGPDVNRGWIGVASLVARFEAKTFGLDCLLRLHSLEVSPDTGEHCYEQWLASFDPTVSYFPDELYSELSQFLDDDLDSKIFRIRRSRDLKNGKV